MTYRTERLLLRTWCEEDIEPFTEMCADPQVMEHFPSLMTRAESVQMVHDIRGRFLENSFGLWAVEIDARFAGFVGLNRTGPHFTVPFAPCHEVGWRLAPWAWGKGYASEAAQESLMSRRQDLDFLHPGTPGWHGAPHVVYSLSAGQWREYRG